MSDRTAPGLAPPEARSLQDLLATEETAYRRLLRLSVRQNRYLRKQDLARLEANAAEWRRYMPSAETARTSRETYLKRLGEQHAIERSGLSMSRLARFTRGDHGRALRLCLRFGFAILGLIPGSISFTRSRSVSLVLKVHKFMSGGFFSES